MQRSYVSWTPSHGQESPVYSGTVPGTCLERFRNVSGTFPFFWCGFAAHQITSLHVPTLPRSSHTPGKSFRELHRPSQEGGCCRAPHLAQRCALAHLRLISAASTVTRLPEAGCSRPHSGSRQGGRSRGVVKFPMTPDGDQRACFERGSQVQGTHQGGLRVVSCFKKASRELQKNFKKASRKLQESP